MRNNRALQAPGERIFIEVGICLSQTFFGSSQVYATIYREHIMGEMDLLLDLIGGLFLWDGESLTPARSGPREEHPFCHGGPDRGREAPERWAGATLPPRLPPPRKGECFDAPPAGAQPWGGLPDWLAA